MKLQDYLRLNVAQAITSARHANFLKYGQMTPSEMYKEIYLALIYKVTPNIIYEIRG